MFKYKLTYFLVFLAFIFAFLLLLSAAFVLFNLGDINEDFYTIYVVCVAFLSIGGTNVAMKGRKEKMMREEELKSNLEVKDHLSEKELKKRRYKK